MTDDFDPIATPLERGTDAVQALLDDLGDDMGKLDARRLTEVALAASMPSYSLPDRPVEVVVSIADDAGLEVEQNIRLSREQASRPEVLGSALGGAAASALRAFYIGDDGTAADDARAAAELQLGSSS